MKNRRRIEITIFRRRTTIVLREKSEVGRRRETAMARHWIWSAMNRLEW